MNLRLVLFALLSAVTTHAQIANGPVRAKRDTTVHIEIYEAFARAEFKKPQSVDGTLFNPFRSPSQRTLDALVAKEETATLTQGDVAKAIGKRGIQGVVPGSRAIIGDELFAVGEELLFADDGKRATLVEKTTCILKTVSHSALAIEVSQQGKPSFVVAVSLREFNSR